MAHMKSLVRTLRPALSELESFHQDLYKVYHTYMPDNDIENIKTIIPSMKNKNRIVETSQVTSEHVGQTNQI